MPVRAPWVTRALAAAVVLELAVGGTALVARWDDRPASPRAAAPAARVDRAAAVEALLAARAEAVLSRDRVAFLAGIDPAATAFRARQEAVFDALADVPLAGWSYRVEPSVARPADAALDARFGPDWWAPRTTLAVGLAGVDAAPVEIVQPLTYVERDGRWYVASDEDPTPGAARTTQVWDEGPVAVVRGVSTLVLGHPAALPELRRLADEVDAAVPRVTAVWGPAWRQRIAVVVPSTEAELGRLLPSAGQTEQLAALAAGQRVYVNPPALAQLSPEGRRVVLTHEVTHVATAAATGPAVPRWLSEGFADHVGFLGAGVPVRVAAQELRAEVRAGTLPDGLPVAADWAGDAPRLGAVYEEAWTVVELLVQEHGTAAVLALYRDLGARPGTDPAGELEAALRTDLGTSTAQLVRDWRAALEDALA